MDRDYEEAQVIDQVRTELLRIKQAQGLTTDLLASRIKKANGERYHVKTVALFLQGNYGGDMMAVARAAVCGWRLGHIETSFVRRKGNRW